MQNSESRTCTACPERCRRERSRSIQNGKALMSVDFSQIFTDKLLLLYALEDTLYSKTQKSKGKSQK